MPWRPSCGRQQQQSVLLFVVVVGDAVHDFLVRFVHALPAQHLQLLEDGAGITLPAGTRLRLRFCEYNAQAQLELLIDKGEFDQLQPISEGER